MQLFLFVQGFYETLNILRVKSLNDIEREFYDNILSDYISFFNNCLDKEEQANTLYLVTRLINDKTFNNGDFDLRTLKELKHLMIINL